MANFNIGVIAGDGIGPAIVADTLQVLQALAPRADVTFTFVDIDAGAGRYLRLGEAISPVDVTRIRDEFDATLKGPVGLPEARNADGTEAGVLGGVLRNGLDAYVNLRPIRLMNPAMSPLRNAGDIDYVIVRENTEGLYASRGKSVGDDERVVDQLVVTRAATERVVVAACEIAIKRMRETSSPEALVTCVDKANVLGSYAFFRSVFDEVVARLAQDEPGLRANHVHVDAAAAALVEHPERFDVIVCENLIGDILSDLAAATVGGLGVCASANLGWSAAYFEPVHGSAPDLIAADADAQGANPAAMMLSAAMMLDYLQLADAATRLRQAVAGALATVTAEPGPFRRARFTELVLSYL